MFNMLDEIEPIIENNGSSVNPWLVTGIVAGPLLLAFVIIMLLRRK